jgi:hypothetical protein
LMAAACDVMQSAVEAGLAERLNNQSMSLISRSVRRST